MMNYDNLTAYNMQTRQTAPLRKWMQYAISYWVPRLTADEWRKVPH